MASSHAARRRRAREKSYASVNWQDPVNFDHALNKGLIFWGLVPPHWSGGTTLRNLVDDRYYFTGTNTESTDWIAPIGAMRPGGWCCIDLGGTNEYFNLASFPLASIYPSTWSVWFRLANATSQFNLLATAPTATGDNYTTLFADGAAGGDPLQCIVQSNGPERIASTTTGFSANTWHWGCMVLRSATDRAVWIDARSKGTNADNDTPSGQNAVSFGALNSGGVWGPVTGQLDSPRIYNRALSDAEVAELYELEKNYSAELLNRWSRASWFVPASGGISSTLSVTLGALTVAATATAPVVATLASTLGGLTVSGSATVDVFGSESTSLEPVTVAGTATAQVAASLISALGALTVSGTATVDVAGSESGTLDPVTLAGSGKVDVAASLSVTLGSLTVVGSATVDATGSESSTLDPVTVAGSGAVLVTASMSATLGALTVSAQGGSGGEGGLSSTLDPATVAGSAAVLVGSSLTVTLGSVTVSGSAAVVVSGSDASSLDPVTVAGQGTVLVSASMSATLGGVTLAALGTGDISGRSPISIGAIGRVFNVPVRPGRNRDVASRQREF